MRFAIGVSQLQNRCLHFSRRMEADVPNNAPMRLRDRGGAATGR